MGDLHQPMDISKYLDCSHELQCFEKEIVLGIFMSVTSPVPDSNVGV